MRALSGILILSSALAAAPARAQDAAGRIPLRIIADRLMVRCDLAGPTRRVPVHLLIELDSPAGLQLHERAARDLGLAGGGRAVVHFPGFKIRDVVPEPGPDDLFAFLTKRYAPELGETAVVGSIGSGLLGRHHLTLDLAAAALELAPARVRDEQPLESREGDVLPIDVRDGVVWLPVELPDGESAMLALGTSRYDTILDQRLCRDLGHPAGDVGAVRAGPLDLSRYVAFRPDALVPHHPDRGAGMTGLNFLCHVRIEVDRVNRYARLTPTVPPRFPQADLMFFRALVADGAEPLERFLDRHPKERLSQEAAQLLLDRRLAEGGAGPGPVQRAIKWVLDTGPDDLRATSGLELVDRLRETGVPELAAFAGRLGLEKGRADRDPNAVHRIHARLGEMLLEQGDRKEAWRHLLSAAFGLREDGVVNLNLGRFYEQEKRWARAFSRYVLAVITEEAAAPALEGLKRVQKAMGQGEAMSIDRIESFIEGRVPAFRAADEYKRGEDDDGSRVVLAELFTGAHCPPCIASDLAFDGLSSFFPRERVAVVEYHLPYPAAEPLMNDVSVSTAISLRVRGTPTALFDGEAVAGGGGEKDKEAKYLEYKDAVLGRLRRKARHTIEIAASVANGEVLGVATIKGPAASDLALQVVLVEKGVLFPGRNKIVVHHMVARASLVAQPLGVPYEPEDGKMVVPFQGRLDRLTDDLELTLEEHEQRTGASFTMWPTKIDPKQVGIVAILRDQRTGEVAQAAQVDPIYPEEELK